MSDAWFAHKTAPDGDTTDGCHPDEAAALKSYLRGDSTPEQVAQAITKPISNSSHPNSDLPRLYDLLMDAFLDLPASNIQPLVTLISAIEILPAPSFDALPTADRPVHGQLWPALPGFGHFWSDDYPSLQQWIRSGGLKRPKDKQEEFLARSLRKAEVEARLAHGKLAGIPLDWGYECVVDTLEWSEAELEAMVPPTCQWLTIAQQNFKDGAEKKEHSWALGKERNLWPHDDEMSVERWDFWMRRLRELQSDENLSESVRGAAKDCLEKISNNNTG